MDWNELFVTCYIYSYLKSDNYNTIVVIVSSKLALKQILIFTAEHQLAVQTKPVYV